MVKYDLKIKQKVKELRLIGKTYSEINNELNISIPKSTLTSWCSNIRLPTSYFAKVREMSQVNLIKARKLAWDVNKINRIRYLKEIDVENKQIAFKIGDYNVGLIALAMLCLGEASKYKTKHKQFSLGSSDPRIIIIFIRLLKRFKNFDQNKMRCTVQCRDDQNSVILEEYWQKITNVPKKLFYPTRKDLRTRGKLTTNKDYKGVLVIDYYDTKIQLILESLADLVYNQLKIEGP